MKRSRMQYTKAELLDRMRVRQALRSTKPLQADQVRDLSMCHHVNLDAICTGQAEPSMLWDFMEGVMCWRKVAQLLGAGVAEMDAQIGESQAHAAQFRATLDKAQKRFAALAKVEERHARHYQAQLDKISA